MGSILQTLLVAIVTFMTIGAALEIALREQIANNASDPDPAAAALIKSSDPSNPVLPLPKQPSDQQPKTRTKTYSCTAAELSGSSKPIEVTITRVLDGDTIKAKAPSSELTVRLWGIDAPELDQPGGKAAQEKLLELAPQGSKTFVYPVGNDIYGRTVAAIGSKNLWAHNMTLVAYGMAYHVDKYESANNYCLSEGQKMAQTWREGVWKQDQKGGVRPWEHRSKSSPSYGTPKGSD